MALLNKTFVSTAGWYVLYTMPRHEKKVYEELLSQRYVSYLPLIKYNSTWSDRQKILLKPLFPSYVFVYLDSISDYYKILAVYGVIAFIKFAGRFATVTETEIDKIKQVVSKCTNVEVCSDDVKIGERRKIMSGFFCGHDCEVIHHKGKDKIVVRIASIQQNLIAEVNISCLADYSYKE
jgi:transcription antitermination factor NusG